MTKGELIDRIFTEEEKRNIDIALPQQFVDDCQNLLNIGARKYYVWSYMCDNFIGEPLNLAELLLEKKKHNIVILK